MDPKTREVINVTAPDGSIVTLTLTLYWQALVNPCDKEPAQYRGEDDGWEVTDIIQED